MAFIVNTITRLVVLLQVQKNLPTRRYDLTLKPASSETPTISLNIQCELKVDRVNGKLKA
jgi:hypothetical protein